MQEFIVLVSHGGRIHARSKFVDADEATKIYDNITTHRIGKGPYPVIRICSVLRTKTRKGGDKND